MALHVPEEVKANQNLMEERINRYLFGEFDNDDDKSVGENIYLRLHI